MSSIVITSALVGALAPVAHAQRADAPRTTQQVQGLRQATPGRLIVPITGTLATPAASATSANSSASSMTQVTGSFSIQRFAQSTAGDVAAFGMLTLNLTDPASGAARAIVTEAAMRVGQSSGQSSALAQDAPRSTIGTSTLMLSADSRTTTTAAQGCEALTLAWSPLQLDVLGMAVRINQVNVDFISRTTGQLRTLLCGTSSVMETGVGAAERVNRLNALLDVVG